MYQQVTWNACLEEGAEGKKREIYVQLALSLSVENGGFPSLCYCMSHGVQMIFSVDPYF